MSLLENYLNNNPMINIKDIKKFKELNAYELLIERNDGQTYIYDSTNNTIRGFLYKGKLSKNENNNEFKFRLKAAILHSGITQRELAKRVGISEISLCRYLNGSRIPNYSILKKIADELEININELYFENF